MKKIKQLYAVYALVCIAILVMVFSPVALGRAYASKICGSGSQTVKTAIDIGCQGKDNPIWDMIYAIIRFLSVGVGIVVVGSIIVAGIQYTVSRGDPQATANALKRVTNAAIALAMYILAFALLNFLVPGGLF